MVYQFVWWLHQDGLFTVVCSFPLKNLRNSQAWWCACLILLCKKQRHGDFWVWGQSRDCLNSLEIVSTKSKISQLPALPPPNSNRDTSECVVFILNLLHSSIVTIAFVDYLWKVNASLKQWYIFFLLVLFFPLVLL